MSDTTEHILLECLCAAFDPGSASRLASLGESDWDEVVASAGRHGVCPLLYERLGSVVSIVRPPERVLAPLRDAFLVNGLRNELLYRDLHDVLARFERQGLPVMALKGAHLAQLVYSATASRQMADLDLLVKEDDLAGATATLQALGYECGIEAGELPAWRQGHPVAFHLPAFAKAGHPRIEMHWTLPYAPGAGELAGCWQRARPVVLAGVETRVLCPEDLVVQLSLHCRLHRFSQGLRPVWDVSEVVRRYRQKMNWERVQSCARAWRAERCVWLGLRLARELMQAPVPETVLRDLQADGFEAHWAELAKGIVLAGEDVPETTKYTMRLAEAGRAWRQASAWPEKATAFLRRLFPSRPYMARYMAQKHALRLHPLQNYTCHLTRALDLFGMTARAVLRGELGDCAQRLRWSRWLDGMAY